MNVLVTGSLGTLGRPLVEQLEANGHRVWGCDVRHDGADRTVRADVTIRHQLERVFKLAQPDLVFHLAAEFGRHNGEAYSEQLWNTAMVGTRNVCELCHEDGVRLAFASSSEVYGESYGEDGYLDEGITEREVILHPNEYALSKWANERQILSFAKRNPSFEAMRLRFFNAYGPGEEPHPFRSVVALFCQKALRGERLPVFEGYHRAFMYIDDFIPTLARVADRFVPGVAVNIGGTDYRSVKDLALVVLGSMDWTLTGVSSPEEMIELIPEDRHNTRSKRPDIRLAKQLLDHDPTVTLEEGVPKTLEWMRGRTRAHR